MKMSAEKVTRRYPHLSNTDLLIKRNIRDAVNAAAGPRQRRVVIHATDNAFECAEVFWPSLRRERCQKCTPFWDAELRGSQSCKEGFRRKIGA